LDRVSRMLATIEHFTHAVFGTPPSGEVDATWQVLEEGKSADGVRRQIRLDLSGPYGTSHLTLLVHLPADASVDAPVPAFCGLNFQGNHACTTDPAVLVPDGRTGDELQYLGSADILDPPPARGAQQH